MPKFLRIGVHQSNVSGYTSKAWWVRRVGSTVFLKWSAVEVHGVGDKRKIYWTIPQEKTIRCGTLQRAKDYVKNAIARRRSHLCSFVDTEQSEQMFALFGLFAARRPTSPVGRQDESRRRRMQSQTVGGDTCKV